MIHPSKICIASKCGLIHDLLGDLFQGGSCPGDLVLGGPLSGGSCPGGFWQEDLTRGDLTRGNHTLEPFIRYGG